ncbi:hypothetical protein F5887DRAFT_658401 [Amanita rubescens]|nr:hypothetical protein F5887DRAFT_658401 [Amanita rubescens]
MKINEILRRAFGSPAHTNGGLNEVEWRSHLQVTGDGDLGAVSIMIMMEEDRGLCINIRRLPVLCPLLAIRASPLTCWSLGNILTCLPHCLSYSSHPKHIPAHQVMVQSFVALSAAFVQLALLAQVSTGVPIPSTDMPSESQVLSKRKEQ